MKIKLDGQELDLQVYVIKKRYQEDREIDVLSAFDLIEKAIMGLDQHDEDTPYGFWLRDIETGETRRADALASCGYEQEFTPEGEPKMPLESYLQEEGNVQTILTNAKLRAKDLEGTLGIMVALMSPEDMTQLESDLCDICRDYSVSEHSGKILNVYRER